MAVFGEAVGDHFQCYRGAADVEAAAVFLDDYHVGHLSDGPETCPCVVGQVTEQERQRRAVVGAAGDRLAEG